MTEPLLLGKRQFHQVDARRVTVEHDLWIKGEMAAARVHGLTMGEDESAEDFCARVVSTAHESRRLLDLMAALLIPVEVAYEDWRPETVADVRGYISKLTASEQPALQEFLVGILVPFLEAGMISLWRSKTVSVPNVQINPGALTPGTATASGPGWYGNYPSMTSPDPPRSSAGP